MRSKAVFVWIGLLTLGMVIAAGQSAAVDMSSAVGIWTFDDGAGTTAADSSGNGLDGVLSGSPSWADGKFGGAISLPGAGDTVAIEGYADGIPTEELTIVLWANVSDDKNQDIFSLEPLEPGRITSHMPWDGGVHWQFGTPFTGVAPAPLGDAVGAWKHWGYVHSVAENRMAIYENGEEVSGAGVSAAYTGRGGGFHIGGRPGSSFAGLVDEFAMFNAALSQADIQSLMMGIVTAVEPAGKIASVWASLKSDR